MFHSLSLNVVYNGHKIGGFECINLVSILFRFSITRGWDLVISRLKAGDSGGYECQVVDRVDRTMTRVTRELIVTSEDKLISLEEAFLQRDDPSSVRGEDRRGQGSPG